MPILTYEQFCECNENLSQQVAIILRKLRRFSRLNFQWLQSKLNLAIVSLFLEDFCRIFRRNNNIRVQVKHISLLGSYHLVLNVVNVNQHFLLIDARLIRRSSSFGSIPEVGGRAFKLRAAHQ